MIPISVPDASGAHPLHFKVLTGTMVVLAAAYLFHVGSGWAAYIQSGPPLFQSHRKAHFSIGETRFEVPISHVASTGDIRSLLSGHKALHSIELAFPWPWPGLAGIAEHRLPGPIRERDAVLKVEIANAPEVETLRSRLNPFFRRLARGGELQDPSGLIMLSLSGFGSAGTDRIVFDQGDPDGFIARCVKTSVREPDLCHRAIPFRDGLTLSYRFERSFLHMWPRLDGIVTRSVLGHAVAETAGRDIAVKGNRETVAR